MCCGSFGIPMMNSSQCLISPVDKMSYEMLTGWRNGFLLASARGVADEGLVRDRRSPTNVMSFLVVTGILGLCPNHIVLGII